MMDRGVTEIEVREAGQPAAIREASAAAVAAGSGLVVLAGGDGTVRDAVGPLAGTGIPVGIVPCGTGNLYATAVGIPRDLDEADRRDPRRAPRSPTTSARSGWSRRPWTGEPAGEPVVTSFVVACGTGFDARLIEATSREAKRRYGVAAYFIAASRLLGHLEPQPTVLTVDGVRTELESVVVLVANCGEAIPGRLRPRLPIEPDDGLLHVFVLPMGGILGGIRRRHRADAGRGRRGLAVRRRDAADRHGGPRGGDAGRARRRWTATSSGRPRSMPACIPGGLSVIRP